MLGTRTVFTMTTSAAGDRAALQLTRDELGADVVVTERAIELLNASTFTTLSHATKPLGYAWTATMNVRGVTLTVEHRADGAANWYDIAGQPLSKVDEIEALVREAMPELSAVATLDRFCAVLEFYQLNRQHETTDSPE
jgi:hypothetical protein